MLSPPVHPSSRVGHGPVGRIEPFATPYAAKLGSPPGALGSPLRLGQRVLVDGGRLQGMLRFQGPVAFQPGLWAGIELDAPSGKNDGSVAGVTYFHCAPLHGIFVAAHRVSQVAASPVEQANHVEGPDVSMLDASLADPLSLGSTSSFLLKTPTAKASAPSKLPAADTSLSLIDLAAESSGIASPDVDLVASGASRLPSASSRRISLHMTPSADRRLSHSMQQRHQIPTRSALSGPTSPAHDASDELPVALPAYPGGAPDLSVLDESSSAAILRFTQTRTSDPAALQSPTPPTHEHVPIDATPVEAKVKSLTAMLLEKEAFICSLQKARTLHRATLDGPSLDAATFGGATLDEASGLASPTLRQRIHALTDGHHSSKPSTLIEPLTRLPAIAASFPDADSNAQHEALFSRTQALELQIAELQRQLQSAVAETSASRDALAKAEMAQKQRDRELEHAARLLDASKAQISALQSQLAEQETSAAKQMDFIAKERDGFASKAQDLTTKLDEARASHTSEIQSLRASYEIQLTETRDDLARAEQSASILRVQLAQTEAAAARAQAALDAARDTVGEDRDRQARERATLAAMGHDGAHESVMDATAQLLQTELAAARELLARREAVCTQEHIDMVKLASANDQIHVLESQCAALAKRNDELASDLSAVKTMLASQPELTGSPVQRQLLTRDTSRLLAYKETLVAQIESLQNARQLLYGEVKDLQQVASACPPPDDALSTSLVTALRGILTERLQPYFAHISPSSACELSQLDAEIEALGAAVQIKQLELQDLLHAL